jgi:signal transduction histidine kinase
VKSVASAQGRAASGHRSALVRLRWIGVALPLAALLLAETVRYLMPGDGNDVAVHLLWGAGAGAAIVVFAVAMFWSIGRAESQIVRQNLELAAVNAVARAVEDQQSSHSAVEAALDSLVASTRASRATVRLFTSDGGRGGAPAVFTTSGPSAGPPGQLVELPLATGSAVVGLLQVWLPEGPRDEAFSGPALQNISHQLGCAIQMRQLVDDLTRRQQESAALYAVAILISDQHALPDTLATILRTVHELLAVDVVAMCLSGDASDAVAPRLSAQLDTPMVRDGDGGMCVTLGDAGLAPAHGTGGVCELRSSPDFQHVHEVPIRSAEASLGDIWAGRRADRAFDAADQALMAGLADLASIAITSARLRDRDRLNATVAERERIARELHDSLAQVLGVTHLRLRAMGGNPAVRGAPEVAHEIDDLAELAQDAYHDVREAILGLRSSSTLNRGLMPGLAAYVEKFSRQSGVEVRLESRVLRDPALPPESEIQVIRVIQEALANVRKHAGAAQAVVRLTDDAEGTTIEVEDNGRGFDVGAALTAREGSFGLQTMRERIELVAGTLAVDSVVGRGTRVTVHIPHLVAAPPAIGGTHAAEAVASGAGRR